MTNTWSVRDAGDFKPGFVSITPAAEKALSRTDIAIGLNRHFRGNYSEVCEEAREGQVTEGFRLFSVHNAKDGKKFWVITEADRRVTTVLMPEDY